MRKTSGSRSFSGGKPDAGFTTITGKPCGFTLSELLIALAILGVIATFTIPKVLQSQSDSKKIAITKEAAAMLSGAYQAYIQANGQSTAVNIDALTPYMNYIRLTTLVGDNVDAYPGHGAGFIPCNFGGSLKCIRLANGSMFSYVGGTFGGTETTRAININLDADGVMTGDKQAIRLFLFYNGRIATEDGFEPQACDSAGCFPNTPSNVPSWFSWN